MTSRTDHGHAHPRRQVQHAEPAEAEDEHDLLGRVRHRAERVGAEDGHRQPLGQQRLPEPVAVESPAEEQPLRGVEHGSSWDLVLPGSIGERAVAVILTASCAARPDLDALLTRRRTRRRRRCTPDYVVAPNAAPARRPTLGAADEGVGASEEREGDMPLFMDVHHKVEGLTAEAVAGAHKRDLEVGPQYGVDYKSVLVRRGLRQGLLPGRRTRRRDGDPRAPRGARARGRRADPGAGRHLTSRTPGAVARGRGSG